MPPPESSTDALIFHPLDASTWSAFAELFGPKGACAGCWCMFWRLPRAEWEKGKGEGNKRRMRALVGRGAVPGLLAFDGDDAVGWCALAPREDYTALTRSRILAPVDEARVWSVSCFFVKREWRGRGVSAALLLAAAEHARAQGATILEGYPVEPASASTKSPAAFVWTGLASAFEKAGFREVARRSPTRPIMRLALTGRGRRRS